LPTSDQTDTANVSAVCFAGGYALSKWLHTATAGGGAPWRGFWVNKKKPRRVTRGFSISLDLGYPGAPRPPVVGTTETRL